MADALFAKGGKDPVLFNVSGTVGANPSSNQEEDVTLVQYLINLFSTSSSPRLNAADRSLFASIKPDGKAGALLILAITNFQNGMKAKIPGTVVDGRVSRINVPSMNYGTGFWTIASLNTSVKDIPAVAKFWPRLDLIPNCPPKVAAMVKREIVGG